MVANKVIPLGYSMQTHELGEWGCGCDSRLFSRLLTRNNALILKITDPIPLKINTMLRCKDLLPPNTCVALNNVHPRLCPDSEVEDYHFAHEDTLATHEVIGKMLSAMD